MFHSKNNRQTAFRHRSALIVIPLLFSVLIRHRLNSHIFDPCICLTDSEPSTVIDLCAWIFWTLIFLAIGTALRLQLKTSTMAVCINCNIVLRPGLHQHEYYAINLSPEHILVIEEWCGREITDSDQLCPECVQLVIQDANNRAADPNYESNRQMGHIYICISCGISLSRRRGRRRYRLSEQTMERTYIENQIFPRQLPIEAWACTACWMRAHHNAPRLQPIVEPAEVLNIDEHVDMDQPAEEVIDEPHSSSITMPSSETESWADHPILQPPPQVNNSINLLNYNRTPETPSRCFVPDCANPERLRIPRYLKRAILTKHKLYITESARVCREHSMLYNWDILNEYEFTSTFTSSQVDNMLDLLCTTPAGCVLNFENVENTSDTLCHYWTGLTVTNFLCLFNSIPQMEAIAKKAKTALGMFLIKLRTGESFARISSLFLISKGTVSSYVTKTRDCLLNFYVPLHLGVDHLTREQHSAHNLLIPQGLFGTEENNPIVICDGTYIYLQKSSNYLFQKKTYSLHKYNNLVKPFMMVTCNGHIIDAFGPYAATQSDADIMKQLFQNANSPLRSYFQQNDVFILDRGFRDAIALLSSLGYTIHKPEGLDVGERQLSTIKANKSRLVTLCRWVVEIVNGRFKRDFKIFREKYFNVASKNLMTDFRIAAALLNNFHPVITDHAEAQTILNRALERFDVQNRLSDYVAEHNLNRHRSNFVPINGQLPELNVFPAMEMSDLILFSLGTYQIKQARSYYGEHIRQNGTFQVEVDTNLLRHSRNSFLMRGRIRSRHQSNKIYYTYILLNLNAEIGDWCQRISEYYCSCIIGKRTVGSCAHVMTIVWYLGWARYQNNIFPPARFLDSILVREDVENEEEE